MNLAEALKATGAKKCDFGPDEDECETCEKPNLQLYYIRTCWESEEGEYHCEKCIIDMPEMWAAQGESLEIQYQADLQKQLDLRRLHRKDFMQRCGDCGKFIKIELWLPKNDTRHPLCGECIDGYDDPCCY